MKEIRQGLVIDLLFDLLIAAGFLLYDASIGGQLASLGVPMLLARTLGKTALRVAIALLAGRALRRVWQAKRANEDH
jgi:hypothetical protein